MNINAIETTCVPAPPSNGSTIPDHSDIDKGETSRIDVEEGLEQEKMGRGARERFEPAWKRDYYCKSTRIINFINDTRSIQSPPKRTGTCYPMVNYVISSCFTNSHRLYMAKIDEIKEPKYYHEVAKDEYWREAMKREIDALKSNGTWKVVDLPQGKKPIGCKWVYKVKYKADGSIERYKARLVAQGFTQVEGVDYHDTYAPVAKMTSVRCLLAVAVAKKWLIEQLDVNNAFLHGDLEEEVYMKIPQGFDVSGQNKACKLLKSLYGLKQASRNWFAKLTHSLKRYGFIQSLADYSLFTYNKDEVFIGVLVYVDDMVVVSNNNSACMAFKSFLHSMFGVKELGKLKFFLGIEVDRTERIVSKSAQICLGNY